MCEISNGPNKPLVSMSWNLWGQIPCVDHLDNMQSSNLFYTRPHSSHGNLSPISSWSNCMECWDTCTLWTVPWWSRGGVLHVKFVSWQSEYVRTKTQLLIAANVKGTSMKDHVMHTCRCMFIHIACFDKFSQEFYIIWWATADMLLLPKHPPCLVRQFVLREQWTTQPSPTSCWEQRCEEGSCFPAQTRQQATSSFDYDQICMLWHCRTSIGEQTTTVELVSPIIITVSVCLCASICNYSLAVSVSGLSSVNDFIWAIEIQTLAEICIHSCWHIPCLECTCIVSVPMNVSLKPGLQDNTHLLHCRLR